MSTEVIPPALYRDPSRSTDERVADLIGRMTRAEKLAQLGSFWAFEVIGDDGLDHERLAALAEDGLGELTRLAGSTNLRPIEAAETANAIQRFLVEETRLGLKNESSLLLVHVEVAAGDVQRRTKRFGTCFNDVEHFALLPADDARNARL